MARWTNDEIFEDLEAHHHDSSEDEPDGLFDYEDVERGLKFAREDQTEKIFAGIEAIFSSGDDMEISLYDVWTKREIEEDDTLKARFLPELKQGVSSSPSDNSHATPPPRKRGGI